MTSLMTCQNEGISYLISYRSHARVEWIGCDQIDLIEYVLFTGCSSLESASNLPGDIIV